MMKALNPSTTKTQNITRYTNHFWRTGKDFCGICKKEKNVILQLCHFYFFHFSLFPFYFLLINHSFNSTNEASIFILCFFLFNKYWTLSGITIFVFVSSLTVWGNLTGCAVSRKIPLPEVVRRSA